MLDIYLLLKRNHSAAAVTKKQQAKAFALAMTVTVTAEALRFPFSSIHSMNLLHHHRYVCFQFRKRNNHSYRPNGSNSVLLTNEKAEWRLRMRCKAEYDGDREMARDRIITFGKYKGKMLGSLPSRYLKWVSNNLRAGHFLEWAKLADQVLQDPIYRDRMEWELALNVLNGDTHSHSLSSSSSAVSELLDISDRFGWDNQDKIGWSKVDFDLLGTSKGGRIPRGLAPLNNHTHPHPHPHPHPSASITLHKSPTRRMQRRERQKNTRLKAQAQAHAVHHCQQPINKKNVDYEDDGGGEMVRKKQHSNQNVIANPFPGRQALVAHYYRARTHQK
ncbi:hypothetical protein PIB30_080233 [Stylosanthes scabra]|uniref:Uncharacterized protein n=1 Tax=Stylosanthes scabra TaxID=79078 RepID=A0ABU6VRN8_9FABA|nr:hypothetical protein [Stylosanthes scabra]